jgi:hypothetical protein
MSAAGATLMSHTNGRLPVTVWRMDAEGWYRDPYGVHEDRWFSAGNPTKLVRDQGVESSDPPPPEPPSQPLVGCEAAAASATGDDPAITDGQVVRAVLDDAFTHGYWPR